MSLSILLHLAILSTLSIAALGQTSTLSAECTNALTTFAQETSCFGSDEGLNGFFATFNSTASSMTNPMQVVNDPNVLQALMAFYDNLCTSQECVTLYAGVLDVCFRSTLAQVRILTAARTYSWLWTCYVCVMTDVCIPTCLTMHWSPLIQLNLDVTLLVDQVVDFSCATNERGQYCAIAQLENVNDVCVITITWWWWVHI